MFLLRKRKSTSSQSQSEMRRKLEGFAWGPFRRREGVREATIVAQMDPRSRANRTRESEMRRFCRSLDKDDMSGFFRE